MISAPRIKSSAPQSVQALLESATTFLQNQGIENPRINAEQLLAHVLGLSRAELYLNVTQPLDPERHQGFQKLLHRRTGHEPLQYILGETEFMSLPFKVGPGVLIPRPETEILVEETLKLCREEPHLESRAILEIGTGSGCIAVSLASYLKQARVTAIDISQTALKYARQNAELNGVSDKISYANLDIICTLTSIDLPMPFDILVANPPYVSTDDFDNLPLEIKNHEPKEALLAGQDGLRFYDQIARRLHLLLRPGGCVALEVGYSQAPPVAEKLIDAGCAVVEIREDLTGIPRVVIGKNFTG